MVKGYVARDDNAQRIIISIRGTHSASDVITDILAFFNPIEVITGCTNCRVHFGFSLAWQAVENIIRSSVQDQLDQYPAYQLLITGHSLGGAVASLLVLPT